MPLHTGEGREFISTPPDNESWVNECEEQVTVLGSMLEFTDTVWNLQSVPEPGPVRDSHRPVQSGEVWQTPLED